MKTAILTGFGRFGRYAENPTQILAEELNGVVLGGHTVHSLVFPTTVLLPNQPKDYGKEIVERALSIDASVIISLGMASEVKGVRVETRCVNWVENERYCTAFENRKPIFNDRVSREARQVSYQCWDLVGLQRTLSDSSLVLETSENAGTYCCNALIYRVLRALDEHTERIPFIFAHIPCTEEAIANIHDFDRVQKTLIRQSDLRAIVEIFLQSYQP